jgi:hypothetical protein
MSMPLRYDHGFPTDLIGSIATPIMVPAVPVPVHFITDHISDHAAACHSDKHSVHGMIPGIGVSCKKSCKH